MKKNTNEHVAYDEKYFSKRYYADVDSYVKRVIKGLLVEVSGGANGVNDSSVAKRNLKVLDAACGAGVYCRYLSGLTDLGVSQVYGLDASRAALTLAAKNCADTTAEKRSKKKSKAVFTQGDIVKLPYKSNFFDFVISVHTIEHVNTADAQKFVSEIYRVLKKGGHFLIITPNGWCPSAFLLKKTWFYDLTHVQFFNPLSLNRILVKAGFKNLKISQYLAKISATEKYTPPTGYYGVNLLDKLFPGFFEAVLSVANLFPLVLIRDVLYFSGEKL